MGTITLLNRKRIADDCESSRDAASNAHKVTSMVEFKAVIADPQTGRSYQNTIAGHHANSLIGKKIGDEFDGIFVSLPGYKLVVTGGTDHAGFAMRRDIEGSRLKRILATKSTGYRSKTRHKNVHKPLRYERGMRRRIVVRGNTISPEITQINMRISSHGSKPIEDLLAEEET
jgi:small subunit ribosomal protein S6e